MDDEELHDLWLKIMAAVGWKWHDDIKAWLLNGVRSAPFDVPGYTDSISDAWTLMEEMVAAGDFVMVSTDDRDKGIWYCDVVKLKSTTKHYDRAERGETAPLAICRAYLAWKAGAK